MRALPAACVSPPTMPSADSCTAIKDDYSYLSPSLWLQAELCLLRLPPGFPAVPQYLSHTSSIKTVQASRRKTQNSQCVNNGFIKHTQITDGGLRGHACLCVARRQVIPHFWIGLPPDPTSRVGSRTGAPLSFLRTFPAPASSNPACQFLALGFPASFTQRFM